MSQQYTEKVMEHFTNPHSVGEIPNADGVGQVGNPVCGDVMYIFISVKDDILTDVKFKTFGCGAAIATSSMVTDLARGKTLEEGLKITRKDVAENLGGLPPQKMHCSNLAADALHEAIHDYLRKQGREPPLPPDAKKPHEEDACEVEEESPIQIQSEVPKE
jgi:nitrogen fixation NifU-like protein